MTAEPDRRLTWNQFRALKNLERLGGEAPAKNVGESYHGLFPYLCGDSARSALYALERRGLVEVSSRAPLSYRLSDAARAALARSEEK